MFCPYCGNELDDNVDVCPKCARSNPFKADNSLSVKAETIEQQSDNSKEMHSEKGQGSTFLQWVEKNKIVVALVWGAIVLVLLWTGISKDRPSKGDYDSGYSDDPFSSCCSTDVHIAELYDSDLDGDGTISEFEIERFAKNHPRFVNDEAFLEWVERNADT